MCVGIGWQIFISKTLFFENICLKMRNFCMFLIPFERNLKRKRINEIGSRYLTAEREVTCKQRKLVRKSSEKSLIFPVNYKILREQVVKDILFENLILVQIECWQRG